MSTCLVLFFALLFMVALPTIIAFVLAKHQKALKVVTIVFACAYFVALFIGTTCTLDVDLFETHIGFDFTENWCSIDFLAFDFKPGNILINLFMMFPLGFIIYVFSNQKQVRKTILFALCLSLFIELYQFILPIYRNTELTDVLYNTLSGLISALYCKTLLYFGAFKNKKLNKNKKQKNTQ